jgi:hypothetical protein
MLAIGEVYRENRMGPRTEPWGTPHGMGRLADVDDCDLTVNDLLLRYEETQLRVGPEIPKLV